MVKRAAESGIKNEFRLNRAVLKFLGAAFLVAVYQWNGTSLMGKYFLGNLFLIKYFEGLNRRFGYFYLKFSKL